METKTYTLDRIEDGFYVFLLKEDESQEFIVPAAEITDSINEGDIVEITKSENGLGYHVLVEETGDMKTKVQNLLEKLKNK